MMKFDDEDILEVSYKRNKVNIRIDLDSIEGHGCSWICLGKDEVHQMYLELKRREAEL